MIFSQNRGSSIINNFKLYFFRMIKLLKISFCNFTTYLMIHGMQFYNKLNIKEQSDLIDKSGKNRIVLSFYKYSYLGNPKIFRNYLYVKLSAIDVLGRIYIASEGINAQISLPLENLPFLRNELDKITFLKNIPLNYALVSENKSFLKLTVKVKNKIVADGCCEKLTFQN